LTTREPARLNRPIACPRCTGSFTPAANQPQAPSWPGDDLPPELAASLGGRWLLIGGAVLAVAVLVVGWLLLRQPARPPREARAPQPAQTRTASLSRSASSGPAASAPKRPAPTSTTSVGKHALLVGVSDYDSGRLAPLRYTENDVEELAAILKGPETGFVGVRLLTTGRGKARAADAPTASNVREALAALLARRKRDDIVLVALSGHGLSLRDDAARKEESYFCPCDAQLNDRTSLICLGDLFKQLDDSGAGVKLLLVDACRDDPGQGRSIDADSVPRPPRGIAALFSCSSGERAFETAKLGKKGHGVFFHHVLEGLRGKAQDDDREVTWARLTEYVTKQVPHAVPRIIGGGARQTPHLVTNLVGPSPVLLRGGAPRELKTEAGKQHLEQFLAGPSKEAASKPDPQASRACNDRGTAHAAKKDYDKAIAYFSEAIRLDPKFAGAYRNRALAYEEKGDLQKALEDYAVAIEIEPTNSRAYYYRGLVHVRQKEADKAIADFSEAIRLDPAFPYAYNDRGVAYAGKKRYDLALKDYNRAIELAPKYALAYQNRGVAYVAQEQLDKAIADFSQAIKLVPQFPAPYLHRGNAYKTKGDYAAANRDYATFSKLTKKR
jgi:tetratricopeptide (TPR) repeat protein